jgi:hypothetical protein
MRALKIAKKRIPVGKLRQALTGLEWLAFLFETETQLERMHDGKQLGFPGPAPLARPTLKALKK